jgi:hypothetical protein
MKFLQIHSFYDAYLARHYAAKPELIDASHEAQIRALLADGFGIAHMWAPILAAKGHETQLVIANDVVSQLSWAQENIEGLKLKKKSEWVQEIALEQVNRFQPDVLHLGDPVLFDMGFVRKLKRKPTWVIGWRAAPTPDHVDWKGMDLLLSHLESGVKFAWKRGVRDARLFYPGFTRSMADAVAAEPAKYDVVFCGQWSDQHTRRNKLIAKVAKASLSKERPFSFGLFLECGNPDELPSAVKQLNQGSRWGMDMHRSLRQGRIVLNAEIDMAKGNAGNMRFFEATGVGSCLLTEHQENVGRYFESDKEIVTFSNADDCLIKIHDLLGNPERLESIANAGQRRCLSQHESGRQMDALLAMLANKPTGPLAWAKRRWNQYSNR